MMRKLISYRYSLVTLSKVDQQLHPLLVCFVVLREPPKVSRTKSPAKKPPFVIRV